MKRSGEFGPRSTADQVLAGIDLSARNFLVTGATSGIGLHTASALAANGAHVFVMSRTLDKARKTCKEIGYHCSALACDLADLDSVSAAAAVVHRSNNPLDAIIAHAAAPPPEVLALHAGIERQFFVNHIGHFALINDLSSSLRDGTGRVVISSRCFAGTGTAADGDLMFDNLDGRRFYDGEQFHRQTQLAAALFSKELSRRLQTRGIAVNAADPGRVHAPAARGSGVVKRLLDAAVRPFRRSPAQGAATSTLLAASPNAGGVTGQYWRGCQRADQGAVLDSAELASRLWALSEDILARHRSGAGRLAHAA